MTRQCRFAMSLISVLSVSACVSLLPTAAADAFEGSKTAVEPQLEAITRELAAGIAGGEWAAWERHACDELLYTTEFGRTMTKRELAAIFKPVPPAERPTLAIHVIATRSRGDAAVLVYELSEAGRESTERYRVTSTYWKIHGSWQLIASQVNGVATDLQQSALSAPAGGRE
jgi:Domain of unknown function (DUF4440)